MPLSNPLGIISIYAKMDAMDEWLSTPGTIFVGQDLGKSGKQVAGTKKVATDDPYKRRQKNGSGNLSCKANSYDEAVVILKGGRAWLK